MNAFIEAHKLKVKEEDQLMYRMSCYINEATFNAVYNSIGLGFGKGFKPVEYRKQSYSDAMEADEGQKELTEEEIREQTIRYFELLELRAFNFRQAKREKEEAEANES